MTIGKTFDNNSFGNFTFWDIAMFKFSSTGTCTCKHKTKHTYILTFTTRHTALIIIII